MNLCTNIVHAMEDKGGILAVKLAGIELDCESVGDQVDVTAGEYIKPNVSDTGKSLSSDVLERIYDPFFTIIPTGIQAVINKPISRRKMAEVIRGVLSRNASGITDKAIYV